jgi:subtilisin
MTLKPTASLLLVAVFSVAALFIGTLAAAQENASILVRFEGPIKASDKAFVRGLGGHISHEYSLVPAIAMKIPVNAIEGLSHNPRVAVIEEDLEVQAMVFDDEYTDTWSISNINAKPVHVGGNTGAGVKVGIIDSGISTSHTDLPTVGGYDWVQDDTDPDDVYGHGTHVGGTVCATVNNIGSVGVAPDCDLYALRVLNDAGSGSTGDILAAVNWAVANDLDIINLSLGRSTDMGSIAEATFQAAYDSGLLIVAAAGNSGNLRGKGQNTIYPANYSSVIAVAATDSNNDRASFSSTGNNVEISAPGAGVHSTWNDTDSYSNPQPVCDNNDPDQCYKDGSGTSMASPQVAGVAALIMAAGVTDNQQVRAILTNTATPLGDSKQFGAGLVNAQAAVDSIVLVSDDPTADAGEDQTVMLAEGGSFVEVTLDGGGSSDADGIVSYEWSIDGSVIASGKVATTSLGLGAHTVTLAIEDTDTNIATDTVVITVEAYQAPEVSTKFQIDDNVKTQGRLNVRDLPAGDDVGEQKNGVGVIVGGPVFAAGYWWWEVNYEKDPDGWSVENWLREIK